MNVEEILGQQLFSGLHIDNDVSVEEIVSCTITTRAILKVSENFVLSGNLNVTFSSISTRSGAHRRSEETNIANTAVVIFSEKFRLQQKCIRWDCIADDLTLSG